MSNESMGDNFAELKDIVRRTADGILAHPETINESNYKDAFEIIQKGRPEKFTPAFKKSILDKLGIKE